MSVRAKFKVTTIERSTGSRPKITDGVPEKTEHGHAVYEPCELQTIHLSPVYANGDPDHENSKFWQASPSGSIQLGTINPAAWQAFDLGAEYYIDFTKAPQ